VRNRYLDLLRAAAIVRVIVYHLFGWPWLSIVLPAMGVMFALAGSLTAASLEKRGAGQVVTSRMRRLLPPLWLLGLVAVPVMLVAGWRQEAGGEHPFSLPRLLFWIFPVGDPPGSDAGVDAWEPLWYIRAYLWFILLSPFLYALYRRIGWAAVALPLALIAVLDVTGFSLPDTADAAMWDFATFGACWIAGFAHRDGRLARLSPWLAYPIALVLGAAALYWLHGHQGEDPWDLNDVSESQALWSVAFVLVALRWQPPMNWLGRVRPLDKLVTLLNARAVTVYLWHNIAIAAVWPVLTLVALDDLDGKLGDVVDLAAALVLTVVALLCFGWAEDLAARRAPRLWPTGGPALRPEVLPDRDPRPSFAGPRPDVRSYSAAAAMTPRPGQWHPAGPRPAVDPAAGRHAAAIDDEPETGRGLPVAGRRNYPVDPPLEGEVVDPWFRRPG
jgi:peptidoglycan/LPS O-acetylase OafA/YrhL